MLNTPTLADPNDKPDDAAASSLAWHARLLRGLMHGSAFAEPAAERHLVQTHISSVLLVGDFAYKLRKPLKLPFLDFSTVEQRRIDCEEELRLNRRTAPALYLDVLPVTGTPEAPRWGDQGPVIDWALRMRRFDGSQQLDRLAAGGRLSAELVDALAARVAAFHAALPPTPAAWGRPEAVRGWAIDNFETLASLPAAAAWSARLAALRRWTEAEFERLSTTLAQRHAAGFVREGHGDLHLGNIVLVDGQPLPFDGIEFNPALRHTDLVADIAFTFMDLQRHGLPALAWRFVNGWADGTGDHAGLVLLHYFAVYRALVRAKVALLRGSLPEADAAADAAAFERDLTLAEQLAAARGRAPRLLLTSGLSGSGKSTLAAALAESMGAVRLRSDVERKRLHGLQPTQRPDDAQRSLLYGSDATRLTFDHLAALTSTLLAGGLDVVVDAAFLRRAERDRFRALAGAAGAQFTLLECVAPEATLRGRLTRRQQAGLDASDADGQVLTMQLSRREPVTPDEGATRVDTDQPLEALRAWADDLAAEPGQP